MSVQPIVVERYRFTDPNGRDAACRIEIVPAVEDRVAVIATERFDNPRMSVTNAVETLATDVCRKYDLDPRRLAWIEFYDYPVDGEPLRVRSYDLVTFQGMDASPPSLSMPVWRPMQDADWRRLGLEPRRDVVKFQFGGIVITTNAARTVNSVDAVMGLFRHARGDWGDLCKEDAVQNERALESEGRLFSVYHDRHRVKFYVITECDRSATTVLLPDDY
ncbi:MAG: hypothetical protein QM770_01965 [Tepidisphaeraceae bacterium]